MSLLGLVGNSISAAGEAAEQIEIWTRVAPELKDLGFAVGVSSDTMEAVEQSKSLSEYFEKETTSIAAGSLSDAVMTMIAAGVVDLVANGAPGDLAELFAGSRVSGFGALLPELPEVVALGALAGAIVAGDFVVSKNIQPYLVTAYDALAQALAIPPDSSAWTRIGTDQGGASLLFDAVFDQRIAQALGLPDATMLEDIATYATSGSGASSSGVWGR
jgi:hypothetical protein